MAETKTIEQKFPKADWTSEQVDGVRVANLDSGAISSDKSEDDEGWTLTTVWPVL